MSLFSSQPSLELIENSVHYNFFYTASVAVQIVSGALQNPELDPWVGNSGKENCLLTGRNL